ncbi:hypothetical protein ACFFRR_002347 [Megaselia abdita]
MDHNAAATTTDWQNSCLEIKIRGKYILENEKWTDCKFLVGNEHNQKIISGHKLIMGMASPVFERMFYGNIPVANEPIPIPDVQPDAFSDMMQYIYTDNINITSFDKACELCYVAKKYILPHVVERCTSYLWSDLSPKNACRAFEFAKLFDEPRLMEKCIEIICTKTIEVLDDPSFMEIEIGTFLMILDQEHLRIDSEMNLFRALSKYCESKQPTPPPSDNKAQIENIVVEDDSLIIEPHLDVESISGEDVEEGVDVEAGPSRACVSPSNDSFIQKALKKIRFLTLTPKQFAEGPARSQLLHQADTLAIFINVCSPATTDQPMPEGFSTTRTPRNLNRTALSPSHMPRQNFPQNIQNYEHMPEIEEEYTNDTRRCYCVRTIRQQNDFRNTAVTDCALTFQVDTDILITGVQVPTQIMSGELMTQNGFSHRYSEILYAHILDAQGSRLTYTHCTSKVRFDSLLEISFDRPVFIHAHKVYKVGVVFNKPGIYPMYQCYQDVMCDGVYFQFAVHSNNCTNGSAALRDGLIRSIVFLRPHAGSRQTFS